jgi:4-hydroxy-tetrahydrodipicolinate reductase
MTLLFYSPEVNMIKVLVNGANGKMGRLTVATLQQQTDISCVAVNGRHDDLAQIIKDSQPDVAIDFTVPDVVFNNSQILIENGVRPIIGTSGLTLAQIETLQEQCLKKKLGGIIAPNFSLGAILMMKYAADAARYFADVEIIEMHHPFKLDAPSGTANKTAQMIHEKRQETENCPTPPHSKQQLARGDQTYGVPIHSVRLPGLFAHQAVIFGGAGELLTIRYDGMDRQCCMPGVLLACRKVTSLDHLIYGLEHLID